LSNQKAHIKLLITMGQLEKSHFSNMYKKADMLASELQAYDGEILKTTFYELQRKIILPF